MYKINNRIKKQACFTFAGLSMQILFAVIKAGKILDQGDI